MCTIKTVIWYWDIALPYLVILMWYWVDSTTIFGYFTHHCIFYLNGEVMEEVWLELVSSSASSQDAHFSLCSFSRNYVGIVFVLSTFFSCLHCDLLNV